MHVLIGHYLNCWSVTLQKCLKQGTQRIWHSSLHTTLYANRTQHNMSAWVECIRKVTKNASTIHIQTISGLGVLACKGQEVTLLSEHFLHALCTAFDTLILSLLGIEEMTCLRYHVCMNFTSSFYFSNHNHAPRRNVVSWLCSECSYMLSLLTLDTLCVVRLPLSVPC